MRFREEGGHVVTIVTSQGILAFPVPWVVPTMVRGYKDFPSDLEA